MNITLYQIMAPLLAFVAILYAWNLACRQKKSIWEAILWTIFWGMITVIALFPTVIDYLVALTGIADRENAVLTTGIGVLFFIVFYLVIRFEEVEQRQVRLIRRIALREAKLDEDQRNEVS